MNAMERKILDVIKNETSKYIKATDVDTRKSNSQFFTSYDVAGKMVRLLDIKKYDNIDAITILEPSAGFGMLIFVLLIKLRKNRNIKEINLDLYENDTIIVNSLTKVLELLKEYLEFKGLILNYEIISDDFLLSNKIGWKNNNKKEQARYDIIISNPPYKKIKKAEWCNFFNEELITNQPNLYHLFITGSLKLLKSNGQYIALTPRNYLVGKYTYKLREWILNNYSIVNLHSFDSRNLFKEVNQEVIISRFINAKNNRVKISHNSTIKFTTSIDNVIFDKSKYMLLLPTKKESLKSVKILKKKGMKLSELSIRCIVGPIVQFRNLDYLSEFQTDINKIPFLLPIDLKDDKVIYSERNTKYKYISNNIVSRLTEVTNGVIVRKITSKDDKNTIVAAVLNKEKFSSNMIGLDSNLIFFNGINREMSLEECYGLYCFLISDFFSEYYLLINGTHTINIFELTSMYFPKTDVLIAIGKKYLNQNNFNKENINRLVNEYVLS